LCCVSIDLFSAKLRITVKRIAMMQRSQQYAFYQTLLPELSRSREHKFTSYLRVAYTILRTCAISLKPLSANDKPSAKFRFLECDRARVASHQVDTSTPPAKFHPNLSKFPRCNSENDVPDRYNNRRSDRISDRR